MSFDKPEPSYNVGMVRFSVLNNEDWVKYAIPITRPFFKADIEKGTTAGTPLDDRLGCLENNKKCVRCFYNNQECQGHFGFAELEIPIEHCGFTLYIYKILKCVCHMCSGLVVRNSPNIPFRRAKRLKFFESESANVGTCRHCNTILRSYKYEKKKREIHATIGGVKKGDETQSYMLDSEEIFNILNKVTDETMFALGFNEEASIASDGKSVGNDGKFENLQKACIIKATSFLIRNLPIIPKPDRPHSVDSDGRAEDDITDKTNHSLKQNEKLRKDREARETGTNKKFILSAENRRKTILKLKQNVWSLMSNKKAGQNTPYTKLGIYDRIGGKKGQLNDHVGAKRVDYATRSVIVAGGPEVEVGEVGVPYFIAKTLTLRERIASWNIHFFQRLLNQRKITRVKRGEQTFNVKAATMDFTKPFPLVRGDFVSRLVMNGDVGILNRQPSLRRESMQGVRFKLVDGLALRVPLSVTKPYGADYDGDKQISSCPQQVAASKVESELLRENSVTLSA